MGRVERRLLAITDEVERLREEVRLTAEELRIHEHLDDDARRDAAVGGPIEREDARITGNDVTRFEGVLEKLEARIARLERRRRRLLAKLG